MPKGKEKTLTLDELEYLHYVLFEQSWVKPKDYERNRFCLAKLGAMINERRDERTASVYIRKDPSSR